MKKPLIVALMLLGAVQAVKAQQDPQYSMYMFNRFLLNPSFAGYGGPNYLSMTGPNITAWGRTQWVGVEGHPNTGGVSFNMPITSAYLGVGGYLYSDAIGPFTTLSFSASVAGRIPVGKSGASFNIGLNIGGVYKTLDGSNWRYDRSRGDDPTLVQGSVSTIREKLGVGLSFHLPDDKFYIGVAVDHLTAPKLKEFTTTGESQLPRQLTTTLGGNINLSKKTRSISLQPSLFYKIALPGTSTSRVIGNPGSNGIPQMQLDVNLNLRVNPMVFGISGRLIDDYSLIGILGFNATKSLFIAYSYDYTFSALGRTSSGSHEVILSYTFPDVRKVYPPNLGVRDKKLYR